MVGVDKTNFREACHQYRASLTEKEYTQLSRQITENLLQEVDLRQYRAIHCYAAIQRKKEIDTLPLLKTLCREDNVVAVPRADFSNLTMTHVRLHSTNELKLTEWGIPEPQHHETLPARVFDFIIIPMVGGDRARNRIGYGKGFYDRFLQQVNALKVGLCYGGCISNNPIETGEYDVKLDIIITENEVIA